MLEGTTEAEVTGITAFSDKNVIYTAGWNKCINVYRDDSEVCNTTLDILQLQEHLLLVWNFRQIVKLLLWANQAKHSLNLVNLGSKYQYMTETRRPLRDH